MGVEVLKKVIHITQTHVWKNVALIDTRGGYRKYRSMVFCSSSIGWYMVGTVEMKKLYFSAKYRGRLIPTSVSNPG